MIYFLTKKILEKYKVNELILMYINYLKISLYLEIVFFSFLA